MNRLHIPSPNALWIALALSGVIGCERPEGDRLVVVTPWSASERAAVDKALHSPRPIAWVVLDPEDDPVKIVARIEADVILGLPEHCCDRLAELGYLMPISPGDRRPWRVAGVRNIGLAVRNGTKIAGQSARSRTLEGEFIFDDPRLDRVSLAWAMARMTSAGYGEIVRSAANAARAERSASALPAVLRGDGSVAPATGVEGAIDDTSHLDVYTDRPRYREGVAIIAGTPHEETARALLAVLAERGEAEPVDTPSPTSADLGAEMFLADLLGATVVDALDDLREAARAVDAPRLPPELNGYLDDPPPWPPSSVAKLRKREDPYPLLETLAREITDDPEAKFWLLQSWDKPERPVNLAFLREMAGAAGGRLRNEPRFRVWLRAEWTAWARQHYRRIAREAGRLGS